MVSPATSLGAAGISAEQRIGGEAAAGGAAAASPEPARAPPLVTIVATCCPLEVWAASTRACHGPVPAGRATGGWVSPPSATPSVSRATTNAAPSAATTAPSAISAVRWGAARSRPPSPARAVPPAAGTAPRRRHPPAARAATPATASATAGSAAAETAATAEPPLGAYEAATAAPATPSANQAGRGSTRLARRRESAKLRQHGRGDDLARHQLVDGGEGLLVACRHYLGGRRRADPR